MSNRKPAKKSSMPKPPGLAKPLTEKELVAEAEAQEVSAKLEAEAVVVEPEKYLVNHAIPVPAAKKGKAKKCDEKPIQVVATAVGYYGGSRRAIDDKFTIHGESALGSWMKKI